MFKLKMAGKQKKNMKKLVFAGIIILGLVGCAKETRATYVDANAVEEGLEYYIRIDKSVYDLGETIKLLHRLTNVGNETLNVCELGIYTLSLELMRPQGDTLFSPYFGPPFQPMPPGLPDIITLNPGEYIETQWHITSGRWGTDGEWVEEPFSIVGQYSVKAKYNGYEPRPITLQPDPLDFKIIPEPASIFLLGLGSAFLLFRQKGKVKCLN
jgi:hypothetical protein